MRIVYLGTPEFAVYPLKRIIEHGHEIAAVVTNMDKPFGRKRILTPPPVKVFAEKLGIKVLQYSRISKEGFSDLSAIKPDIMVTCAFGQILSQSIIDIPKYGVINIHASLLPKYRGAAPVQWAVIYGEKETGVTIMNTEKGLDTGEIILQRALPIERDTADGLFEKLKPLAGNLIVEALELIESGRANYIKQDEKRATKCGMLSSDMANIDWKRTAGELDCFIRGLNSWPVAYTYFNGLKLKVWAAEAIDGDFNAEPGELIALSPLTVRCGQGALNITEIQKEGGKRLKTGEFLRGFTLNIGDKFGV